MSCLCMRCPEVLTMFKIFTRMFSSEVFIQPWARREHKNSRKLMVHHIKGIRTVHPIIAEFSSESLIVSLLRDILFIESFNNQYESGAISFSSVASLNPIELFLETISEHKRQPGMESWFCCSTLAIELREQRIFIGDHRSFISFNVHDSFPKRWSRDNKFSCSSNWR